MNRQFLSDAIDQLDLAVEQLTLKDRNYDRFALLLVDNVAELILHKFAQDKAREQESWGWLKKEEIDLKALEGAVGQNFDLKVKFALKMGLITPQISASILFIHRFRNTAYHRGMRHEGVLHSLAKMYLIIVCGILKEPACEMRSWSNQDVISPRARKYLGASENHVDREEFESTYNHLIERVELLGDVFLSDLQSDMNAVIERTDLDIRILSHESRNPKKRDKAVISSQAWHFAFSDEAKAYTVKQKRKPKTVASYVKWLEDTYNWPIKRDPIPSWRKRLSSLASTKDIHLALKKYCDFLSQTESIREQLDESAYQFERYIDMQIDLARGK